MTPTGLVSGATTKPLGDDVSRERPEFFSFPEHLPQMPNGRKEFNHYAPDFVYKYVKVSGMTIADLKEAAVAIHAELEELRD